MAWTEEQKTEAISAYKAANPTPENSTEIIKEIAEDLEQTANGVRMVLVQAGVYVKKDTNVKTPSGTSGTKGTATTTRVSKDSQIAELREAIIKNKSEVDEEIISKLTGKAAAYFAKIIGA
jgi:hypothetical protein